MNLADPGRMNMPIDLDLWHRVQRIVYPRCLPSDCPPFHRNKCSVRVKPASWLYYTLLDDSALRAKVIP